MQMKINDYSEQEVSQNNDSLVLKRQSNELHKTTAYFNFNYSEFSFLRFVKISLRCLSMTFIPIVINEVSNMMLMVACWSNGRCGILGQFPLIALTRKRGLACGLGYRACKK